ncbi:uncharacterized protein LOC112885117 [Panicum hallii]|uniref:uncharacterized protein LOC112885117 n=1 Tax=Panicum hallii TaxID=206008 RepID=UPI000DF4CE20|nr:uncharacterized protein LOC112885117 [Panicum hallii]
MEVERASSYPSRRWRSPIVFEAGDASSFSFRRTKRSRIFDDSSDDDDDLRYVKAVNDGGDEEEVDGDEGEQVESETEYSPLNAYYGGGGGGDAVAEDPSRRGGGRAGEDQLPRPRAAEEEEDSDDERPIRFVRRGSAAPAALRRGSTEPSRAAAPAPVAKAPEPSPSSCSDSSSVIRDATVEDNGALDCSICYLPLKPPIFQVQYTLYSAMDSIHGVYSSYFVIINSDLIKTIWLVVQDDQVAHAAPGCAHRPAYHDREAHARACPHAPCRCPGEACGDAGPAAALADHGWPCTAENEDGAGTNLILRDGFNFLTASRAAASPNHGAANKFLFLLNMVPARPFGRAITAFCIHPDRTATATLQVSIYGGERCNDMCIKHLQWSKFKVWCTDLSDGLPDPSSGCFVFVVPGPGREEGDDTTRNIVGVTPPHIQ